MAILLGKIIIEGSIVSLTGLHIGGSKTSKRIGDVDNSVIKTANGVPYIPGSSLKGKLRSMIAKKYGSVAVSPTEQTKEAKEKTDIDFVNIVQLFGYPGENDNKGIVSRVLVRDAALDIDKFKDKFKKKDLLDDEFSQVKFENTINRRTGTTQNGGLRQLERVPAGSIFKFEMVYDLYNDADEDAHLEHLLLALNLLQDDYIGGSGSRGYGQIKFEGLKAEKWAINGNKYEKDSAWANKYLKDEMLKNSK